jgi:hypothetical protein
MPFGLRAKYVAAQGDPVIGIIMAKHAEGYRVDIGTSQPASLDGLAFEGATKRTKPNLKVRSNHLHFYRSYFTCLKFFAITPTFFFILKSFRSEQ